MRVVSIATATRSSWGTMFLREFLAKLAIAFFLGWLVLPYFWLLWDKNKQQLWDKMLDTVVVDDPGDLVGSVSPAAWGYAQAQQPHQQYQLPQPGPHQPDPYAPPQAGTPSVGHTNGRRGACPDPPGRGSAEVAGTRTRSRDKAASPVARPCRAGPPLIHYHTASRGQGGTEEP
jgi:hypothetical protein